MPDPGPNHINHTILPALHPSMYLMHKYWARKPFNVVANYIKEYTLKGEIVLDPFCGSGVTIAESLINGRKAIGVDINPFAIFLTENTINQVDINLLQRSFKILSKSFEMKYKKFYSVSCPFCNNNAEISQIIWINVNKNNKEIPSEEIEEIRISCIYCKVNNKTVEKNKYKDFYNTEIRRVNLINENYEKIIEKNKIREKIPRISFKYKNGNNYRQLRHFLIEHPAQIELFTKRNLIVLGLIKKEIEELNPESLHKDMHLKIKDLNNKFRIIKNLLLLTFSANLGQSSKMVWVISKRKKKTLKKKQTGSWTHHFFWNPNEFFETNPWRGFKIRFRKTKRAKTNLNQRIDKTKLLFNPADKYIDLTKKDKNSLLLNISAENIPIPENSVDYIFTDPPYGDSIQYFELSSLWNGWIFQEKSKFHEKYEIIVNPRQNKDLEDYSNAIFRVFRECYRVLKIGRFLTITFHNTDISVRNKLILSVIKAGFTLDGLLFQISPRRSLKSYLHYKNSPVGDYYIRFKKEKIKKKPQISKSVNFTELKSLITSIITEILIARGEPSPIFLIFNFIDESLFKKGLIPLENPEFISKIFEELEDSGIIKKLEDSGELWFGRFFWNEIESEIKSKPLSQRIKKYLKNKISVSKDVFQQSKRPKINKQTYSELYNEIYKKFNGILTPDRRQISKILDEIIKN
ncbi:MAG: DNA methyltransferase [Promethearchaeota archaeon]